MKAHLKAAGMTAVICVITVAVFNRIPAIGPLPSGKKILGSV